MLLLWQKSCWMRIFWFILNWEAVNLFLFKKTISAYWFIINSNLTGLSVSVRLIIWVSRYTRSSVKLLMRMTQPVSHVIFSWCRKELSEGLAAELSHLKLRKLVLWNVPSRTLRDRSKPDKKMLPDCIMAFVRWNVYGSWDTLEVWSLFLCLFSFDHGFFNLMSQPIQWRCNKPGQHRLREIMFKYNKFPTDYIFC